MARVQNSMSIGTIGNEDMVFKRKFRWTLEMTDGNVTGPMWYALTTSRPTFTIEETAIDHLHEKHYISGKPTWETINISVYDVKQSGANGASASEALIHSWLNQAFKFSKDIAVVGSYNFLDMGDHDAEYKVDMTLRMLDGHGACMETWWLLGCWPTSSNFGDLDYSSSDTANVEMTVRFDRAQYFPNDAGIAKGGAPGI